MVLLDFVIQFGKFYSTGGSGGIDWVDIFFRSLTIAIAIAVPLFVFYRKIKLDKKIESEKKEKEQKNDLLYFYTVINNIVDNSQQQINGYKKFVDSVKAKPIQPHQLLLVNPENLNRILNKYDQQKIFHAYINQFNERYKARAIKNFMTLYDDLDIYLALYNQAMAINHDHYEFMIKYIGNYVDIAKGRVLVNIDYFLDQLQPTNPELFEKVSKLKADVYNTVSNEIPLSVLQEKLIAKIKPELENDIKSFDLGAGLLNDCRIATSIYVDIETRSNVIAREIMETHDQLIEIVKSIKRTSDETVLLKKQ